MTPAERMALEAELDRIARGYGFALVVPHVDDPCAPDFDRYALAPSESGGQRNGYPYPGVGYRNTESGPIPCLSRGQVEWILGRGSPWKQLEYCVSVIDGHVVDPDEIVQIPKYLAESFFIEWLFDEGMPGGPAQKTRRPR